MNLTVLNNAEETQAPNFHEYDLVMVNSSAGKDSQAMLDFVVAQADAQGFSRSKIVVVHADLGRCEWEGTMELAERQAFHYGLRFESISRSVDLLDHVAERGMWPSSSARYCTSDHKRDQIAKLITKFVRELKLGRQAKVLNCIGLRAEESPARAKRLPFQMDKRASSGRRHVDTWLPILRWSEAQVWQRIRESGVEYHGAYDLGMPRLSCVFCVFAPKAALIVAGRHNRKLLDEYCEVEERIQHTFRMDLSLAEVREHVDAGLEATEPVESWAM